MRVLGASIPAAGLMGAACSDEPVAAKPDAGGGADALPPDKGAATSDLPFTDGSAMVPDLNAATPDTAAPVCMPTRSDALGPFHLSGAPYRVVLADANEPGDRVLMSGTVRGPDCTTPLAGAIVDVWHADSSGVYHSDTKTYRLRGQMKTDAQGRYQFESIYPGNYDKRPRHYHFIFTMPGHTPLTTQCYFQGDPYLGPNDSCQKPTCDSSDPTRILALGSKTEGGKIFKTATFNVNLKKP